MAKYGSGSNCSADRTRVTQLIAEDLAWLAVLQRGHVGARADAVAMGETDRVLARSIVVVVLVGATAVAACGDDDPVSRPAPSSASSSTSTSLGTSGAERRFPDIVDVVVTPQRDTFRFDVTVSSPYDTPERYADAWRIVAPDGTELGVRELTHDHAGEQPFTRSLSGVVIPPGVTEVTVEGRDLVNGWGGAPLSVTIER